MLALAVVAGGTCLYLGISASLHAENSLHAIRWTIKDVNRFVTAERRWPSSWEELGLHVDDDWQHPEAWRVESARRQEFIQIDFDADLSEIASHAPEEFKAISPTGVCYPFTHYADLEELIDTVCHVADAEKLDAKAHSKNWIPYSEDVRAKHLSEGKDVFVFVYAELNAESPIALASLDFSKLATLATNGEFATLLHRYADWNDQKIRSLWKEVGHTKKPFIVHYVSGKTPRVLDAHTFNTSCRRVESATYLCVKDQRRLEICNCFRACSTTATGRVAAGLANLAGASLNCLLCPRALQTQRRDNGSLECL